MKCQIFVSLDIGSLAMSDPLLEIESTPRELSGSSYAHADRD